MFKTIKAILVMVLFASVASAQSFVSGIVTDGANGEALPGANVLIMGTTQGTQTDRDGKFELRIPQRNFTIQVSFIGFQTYTKTIKANGNVDLGTIKLMEGANELTAVEIVASRTTAESPFVFAHVFNALDAVYIQDAEDNSRFNAFYNDHDADDAEVFFGLPRNFNAGFTIRF